MWLPFLPEIGDWGRSEERDGLGHEPARRERYEWHLPILPESAIRLPILPEIRGGLLWICLRMGGRGSKGHCRFCRDSNFLSGAGGTRLPILLEYEAQHRGNEGNEGNEGERRKGEVLPFLPLIHISWVSSCLDVVCRASSVERITRGWAGRQSGAGRHGQERTRESGDAGSGWRHAATKLSMPGCTSEG